MNYADMIWIDFCRVGNRVAVNLSIVNEKGEVVKSLREHLGADDPMFAALQKVKEEIVERLAPGVKLLPVLPGVIR